MYKLTKDILEFVLSGNINFTVVSKKTGTKLKLRIERALKSFSSAVEPPWFIHAVPLEGGTNYKYVSFIKLHKATQAFIYSAGKYSKIKLGSETEKAVRHVMIALLTKKETLSFDVYYKGTCRVCGRTLTDPDSIERGCGPTCYKKTIV